MRKRCAGSTPAARTTRADGADCANSMIQKQASATAIWMKLPSIVSPVIETRVGMATPMASTAASAAAGRSTIRTAA
ncbi:hypothetical protein IVB18_32345 [Bradyrhizobium sp. 186]|uniref:hypothetical protein n=1 Tax=Bradyrhizobium sp. 186 TaxID=2782654 RepID=UPI00200160C5|nr:hypothetical protein [Bradyrhizobium sp. 186]UPK32901.1 hypothetical protein IVB18_32345 [Bradyrhizobium sp. 186]